MSWSVDVTGSKAGASRRVTDLLDKAAASYLGRAEADDVRFAKERILALINACDLSTDGYTNWNAVVVKANGSHCTTGSDGLITTANLQISVTRTSLALE